MSKDTARLERMLGANLLWFGRVLNKRFEALLAAKGGGLTMAQARILLRLDHFGPLSQRVLAEITEVEPPTLARTVSLMERQGLLRRARNPDDQREVVVTLAAGGCRKVPVLIDLFSEAEAWLTEGLPRSQVEKLVQQLSNVRKRLAENAPGGARSRQDRNGSPDGALEEAS
jgi:DNA-binding MarR family transcriptional regulator